MAEDQLLKVYLSMKEGSLFCSYEIHRPGMLHIVFLVSFESSRRGGVHGLGSMAFALDVQKLLSVIAENFGGIRMCLWCCWKDLDEQDLMEFGQSHGNVMRTCWEHFENKDKNNSLHSTPK